MERHLHGRFPFEYAVALYYFSKEGGVQNLLHELKYKGKTEIGFHLGEILGKKITESDLVKPDVIIPLPLFWKKEKQRGYNQSQFFAEGLSAELQIPVASNAIKRIRESESQTRKSRFDRIENVEHIFQLKDNHQIDNKHILLVDDVLTTGATIEACADAILQAKNVRLSIATIAVTT
jgi:ComF family protein